MIRNYIVIAWRNIIRHRFYSLVNVIGLSVGILFVLLIGAYVWSETNVNGQLKNAGRQYFLESHWRNPDQGQSITTVGPVARELKEKYPTLVANYYRWDGISSVVSKGDKHIRENLQIGDSTLLTMYGFELASGNASTALNSPYSIVITPEVAMRYFGKEDVLGETLDIQSFNGSHHDFKITGVLKPLHPNSVTSLLPNNGNTVFLPANSLAYFGRNDIESWQNLWVPSYIELKPGAAVADIERAIKKLLDDNTNEFTRNNLTVKPVELRRFYLSGNNGVVTKMLYALSFVGLFILLMAVVNFVNIAISSSTGRTREIGIRKVLGGLRRQLIIQFLAESVMLVFIATLLAVAAYPMTRDLFAQMVGRNVPALTAFPLYFTLVIMMGVLLIGALAGLYPALVLSALKSVDSLKGKLKSVREKVWLRKSLVGFQFAIAAVVMIGAFIISSQINLFFSRGLGYDKEFVVSAQVPRDWTPQGVRKMETVRSEFAKLREVQEVSLSYEIPNGNNGWQPPLYRAGADSTQVIASQMLVTDAHYLSTYRIAMKEGEFFRDGEADSSKVVINETAARALGWNDPSKALNEHIRIPGIPVDLIVQGVTTDFHFNSMQQKIAPIVFVQPRFTNSYRFLSFKLKPGNIGQSIAAIEKTWSTLLPGSSFEYKFMDETLRSLYASEIQLKKAAYTATGLSLIIVLLGVLGMVSLSIHKRIKEIGIRKVIGASLADIILLFVKEFLLIILAAGLIACPLAYWMMSRWLEGYTYRVDINLYPFAWSILGICAVTLLLIVARTARAALANPVKSLRSE